MKSQAQVKGRRGSELPLWNRAQPASADEQSGISVAIIHLPETIKLATAIETLLANASDLGITRLEYGADCRIKPESGLLGVPLNPDVVVLPLHVCPANQLGSIFNSLRCAMPNRPVLIAAANVSFDFVTAVEHGASDFLLPPLNREELLARIRRQARAVQHADADSRVRQLKEQIGLKQIIGESAALLHEVQRVPRFARCDATVLISGESGTGKEIFARAIHYLSPRSTGPFVPVNCGALPEHLMESEIFGHKRGAFTGAVLDHAGLISEAEDGTLFLDEIDALTARAQVKLLRFLQDGEYRAVGSQQISYSNIRILAAGNTDFTRLAREGRFREDLYYRLNVLPLTLPPLRERGGDILLLAHYFLQKQASVGTEPAKKLSFAAIAALLSHSWPGNVRELENTLTRAVILCNGDTIELADLQLPKDQMAGSVLSFHVLKSRAVWRFEHDFLKTTLRAHDGNITRAAAAVKKNRRAFWELLRKHGLLESEKRA